jgi:hypothetical protein
MRAAVKAAIWMLLAAFALQNFAVADAAASERKRHAKAHAGPQRIVCGMTGCFEVPPGCRHEMRANGYGIIAVVICDRK